MIIDWKTPNKNPPGGANLIFKMFGEFKSGYMESDETIKIVSAQYPLSMAEKWCLASELEQSETLEMKVDQLTDDERLDLFGRYCKSCGTDNPHCHCWNDE